MANSKSLITKILAVICLVNAIITADIHWVIAGAIFEVAASVRED